MNLRPFQIILLAIFGVMAIVALVLLSRFQATKTTEELAYGNEVIIWGTIDGAIMERLFQSIAQEDKAFAVVRYRYIDEAQFDDVFLNAVAEGRSPHLIVLKSDDLVKQRAKLVPIPYERLTERTYRDTYVDGAEIFALRDGVYAIPFAVDPLMMYWNRDIFASNGIAQAPTTWEAVVGSVVPKTTRRDVNRDITQASIAFGDHRNVFRMKDVLIMLALQLGSASVTESDRGYMVGLNESIAESGTRTPLVTALEFFTSFSNANSSDRYTWNGALPMDAQAFIAGDLALYFGRGSEITGIDTKNPNLNFDVAMVPQGGDATARRTYGTFYGFAIPRASTNVNGAYAASVAISSKKYADELTRALNMAPVRRDSISAGDSNPYRALLLESALIARGWLDPKPSQSNSIFVEMISDVISNSAQASTAVGDAVSRLVLEY